MVRPTQFLSSNKTATLTDKGDPGPESIPRKGKIGGEVREFSEKDSAYGELALRSPLSSVTPDTDKSQLISLDWQSKAHVPILRNLQRLTAPNPGVMTGPGTNTYIIGTALTGYIVLDPGPFDPEHTARVFSACNGNIKMIVCTHSHPDHSPGALPLQALCVQNSSQKPPILGLASKSTAKATSQFTPDRELSDGERLVLEHIDSGEPSRSETHTLQVVYTPGHAANHVCFMLLEDGLLFSGDHVLNGSTTVVDPPDGHMGKYLNSLQTLANLCNAHHIEFILPAHGYVLGNYLARPRCALEVIENLYQHRMKREAKILKVLQQNPSGSMDDWVQFAYDDVPPNVWPIAKRSLLAHVENLKELGLF